MYPAPRITLAVRLAIDVGVSVGLSVSQIFCFPNLTREGGELRFLGVKRTLLYRLLMADYSSLASIPLVPGRVFYAPQVGQKTVFISLFSLSLCIWQVLLARNSAGNLDILAILLSSPFSKTHLVTQVYYPIFIQFLPRLRIMLAHKPCSSGKPNLPEALCQDARKWYDPHEHICMSLLTRTSTGRRPGTLQHEKIVVLHIYAAIVNLCCIAQGIAAIIHFLLFSHVLFQVFSGCINQKFTQQTNRQTNAKILIVKHMLST